MVLPRDDRTRRIPVVARAVAHDHRVRLLVGGEADGKAVQQPHHVAVRIDALREDVAQHVVASVAPHDDHAARVVRDERRLVLHAGGAAREPAVRQPQRGAVGADALDVDVGDDEARVGPRDVHAARAVGDRGAVVLEPRRRAHGNVRRDGWPVQPVRERGAGQRHDGQERCGERAEPAAESRTKRGSRHRRPAS